MKKGGFVGLITPGEGGTPPIGMVVTASQEMVRE